MQGNHQLQKQYLSYHTFHGGLRNLINNFEGTLMFGDNSVKWGNSPASNDDITSLDLSAQFLVFKWSYQANFQFDKYGNLMQKNYWSNGYTMGFDFAFSGGVTKFTKIGNPKKWNLDILKGNSESYYYNVLYFGYEKGSGYNNLHKRIYNFKSFNIGVSPFTLNFGRSFQNAQSQFKMGQAF